MAKDISNKKFNEIKNKVLVIDVRTKTEYKLLPKIKGAINVPIKTLLENPKKYISALDQQVITICNGGNRSSQAADYLTDVGYEHTYVLTHGIYGFERWEKSQKIKTSKNKKSIDNAKD